MPRGASSAAIGPRSHIVHFYAWEGELAEAVGDYLAGALAERGTAVVLATLAHQRLFEERLAGLDVDVAAARKAGALVTLDASTVVGRLAAAGRIDPAIFDTEVAEVVRAAGARHGPVRVYGELVALLWDAGHINAALELETRWNELGQQACFGLYCAYPERVVCGDGDRDAIACLHETCIIPPPASPADGQPAGGRAARAFGASRQAPRAARHFVTETLRRWGAERAAGDAAIIVTELATNAVVHARSGFTVGLAAHGGTLRISVSDAVPLTGAGRGAPLPVAPGHGLGVVAALAHSWGIQPAAGGKAVWAELRPV